MDDEIQQKRREQQLLQSNHPSSVVDSSSKTSSFDRDKGPRDCERDHQRLRGNVIRRRKVTGGRGSVTTGFTKREGLISGGRETFEEESDIREKILGYQSGLS